MHPLKKINVPNIAKNSLPGVDKTKSMDGKRDSRSIPSFFIKKLLLKLLTTSIQPKRNSTGLRSV